MAALVILLVVAVLVVSFDRAARRDARARRTREQEARDPWLNQPENPADR